ncbi:MAG TPA: hypothetical protein VIN59_03455 [Alphaproteobacteria bacterium]
MASVEMKVHHLSAHTFARRVFGPALVGKKGMNISDEVMAQARSLKFVVGTLQRTPTAQEKSKSLRALHAFLAAPRGNQKHAYCDANRYVGNMIELHECGKLTPTIGPQIMTAYTY